MYIVGFVFPVPGGALNLRYLGGKQPVCCKRFVTVDSPPKKRLKVVLVFDSKLRHGEKPRWDIQRRGVDVKL